MKKMLIYLQFSLFFILASFGAMAQDVSIDKVYLLKGFIVNSETDEPLPLVTVYNKGSQSGITSSESGKFSINFQAGDSIVFQSLGFENYVWLADDNFTEGSGVTIKMQQKTYELNTVDVTAFKTAEDLKRHILAMDMPLEDKIEIPGLDMIRKEPTGEPLTITGPVSFLYENFSRRAKDHRKFLVNKESYEKQQSIASKYKEAVQKILKVEDPEELEEFMTFCKLQDSFIESANEYDLIVAVNKCYDEFKVLKSSN